MIVQALVPLSMYRVRYELAFGRPYSRFEELLLHAVCERPDGVTFPALSGLFQLHDRLLTEGLVTLIQEGWVAMDQVDREIHYLVTEEGRETVTSGRRPSNLKVRAKHASIIRERVTGQLAAAKDLPIVTVGRGRRPRSGTAWKYGLRPKTARMAVNGGEVERFLPRGSEDRQEWIRWIESPTRVSQDLHYLPVRADLSNRTVAGLPYHWRHLEQMIIDEITERADEYLGEEFQQEVTELLQQSSVRNGHRTGLPSDSHDMAFARTTAACTDLTLTAADSRQAVADLLSQCRDHALVVVGRLNETSARAVQETIGALASRGVQVDLLWSSGVPERTREIFAILSTARSQAAGPGSVVFNTGSAELPADLLLVSTPDGPRALVGAALNCAEEGTLNPAVRLTDLATLAALARLAAGWWETYSDVAGSLPPHRWKAFAEQWAGEAVIGSVGSPAPNCPYAPGTSCEGEIILLTGPRHRIAETDLFAQPSPRLLVADGRSEVESVAADMAASLPEAVGGIFRVFGGHDGWRSARRRGDHWSEQAEPGHAPASHLSRIVAARDGWLVHNAGGEESSLAYLITGHLAAKAWERTART